MAPLSTTVSPALLEDLHLLKREEAYEKIGSIFDGKMKEICLQTRHPKQIPMFINACLARRGELDSGAGTLCYLIRDRATWEGMCAADQPAGLILIAEPELDFGASQGELLSQARKRDHAVIYSHATPRPDATDIVVLIEPKEHEVRDVLKNHGFSPPQAEKLAVKSSGNVYLLTCLLTGTTGRPAWLTVESAYRFRGLALLGGWDDSSVLDQEAITKVVGEDYAIWTSRIFPLTRQNDPPLLLEGRMLRPVSRYEHWQLLCPQLSDADLRRFAAVAKEVLGQDESENELEQDTFITRDKETRPPRYSGELRESFAETLALLAAQGRLLDCSPNLAQILVDDVVRTLLEGQCWIRWASLSRLLPKLAEASPASFLSALESALATTNENPIRRLFVHRDNLLFGRSYHPNLLWALETLAWWPDYLNRVCLILTQLAKFKLPGNSGNTPLGTLTSIFLPWLPQTLAPVDGRVAAVECVISEDLETGWKLLLNLLPKSHQSSSYNPKPVWRDWFPEDWTEGETRAAYLQQVKLYTELSVSLALEDPSKITQLIGRWGDLPHETSGKLLAFLKADEALQLPEDQRYSIWEKLSSQVRRHRKYASSQWAMPEDEVLRLEEAASAIKPTDPLFTNRWLFNSYDHELFESDDYETETAKVARRREEAVQEILSLHGAAILTGMARSVSQSGQLGSAAARTEGLKLDGNFLPTLLSATDEKVEEFVRGYVWSRYWADSMAWITSLAVEKWGWEQQIKFLSYLPFHARVWRLAEELLGSKAAGYWNAIRPNVFQAQEDLLEAARKAMEYTRPEIAIDCIHAMLYNKAEVPVELATASLEAWLRTEKGTRHLDQYHLLEVLEFIQKSPEASEDRVAWIEFHCMALLDQFSSGRPLSLERKLARDPTFFHEIIGYCYRSRHEEIELNDSAPDDEEEKAPEQEEEIDERRRALATQAYRLLDAWAIVPGGYAEGIKINESEFVTWFDKTKELCVASGHWQVAQLQIGNCLINVPGYHDADGGDPVGMRKLELLLQHPLIAKVVDSAAHEHLRRGMTTELFNSRGVHGFSHGKEEGEIARKYRAYAMRFDEQKLPRIATSLRELAENYERDAEREKKREP